MTPQEAYLDALEALRVVEAEARRRPTADVLRRVSAAEAEARALYEAVPRRSRPVTFGNPPRPLHLSPRSPATRRARHSDWHPMSWRGQDN